jgi:hypothetical protein
MPNNIPITPGSGAIVATDDVTGIEYQKIKLDVGAPGSTVPLVGTTVSGVPCVPVDVQEVLGDVSTKPKSGQVWPVNDNGGSLTVDDGGIGLTVKAVATAPAAVRLSDGTAFISGLPVSGTVAATQSTAAAPSGAWPVKISDGTNTAALFDVAGEKCVSVAVKFGAGGGSAQNDGSTFTEGASPVNVVGGEYNTAPSAPSNGKAAGVQVTQARGFHVNLRNAAGTEIGTGGAPVKTDPTGTTTQPVSIPGNSETTPLFVSAGQPPATPWHSHVSFTGGQTAQVIRTPTASKTSFIQRVIVTVDSGATAGALTVYDNTDTASTRLYKGKMTPGSPFVITYNPPRKLAAVNDVLYYTTGASVTGELLVDGYEE